jgi:hypothetical protein
MDSKNKAVYKIFTLNLHIIQFSKMIIMAQHHHYATTVVYKHNEDVEFNAYSKFSCLWEMSTKGRNPETNLFVLAKSANELPKADTKFIVTDFKYKKQKTTYTYKVLFPILKEDPSIYINHPQIENLMIFYFDVHGFAGRWGCTPKNYALWDDVNNKLYQVEIENSKYALMMCFPDGNNLLGEPYLAFCIVAEQHLGKKDVMWAHDDDPTQLKLGSKSFIIHNDTSPL